MLAQSFAIFLFLGTCAALLMGYPVALTLGGVALLFAGLGHLMGAFDTAFLFAMPSRIYSIMSNEILITVPLFIFMGTLLERAKLAEDLLQSLARLFAGIKGGLGISITLVGALLAASTGIVGATVVTVGLLSLPGLLQRGYDPKLASGIITASGTLGQIIPPSIVLVLLGDVMGNAYQDAQLMQGVFAPETVSVGELFAGAILPGLLLVGLYICYQLAVAWWRPASSPATEHSEPIDWIGLLQTLLAPLALILAVLGSILFGFATPSEAASVGAMGTIYLAAQRLYQGVWYKNYALTGVLCLGALVLLVGPLGLMQHGRIGQVSIALLALGAMLGLGLSLWTLWHQQILAPILHRSAETTAMVFLILIGAALFSLVFRGFGGDDLVHHWLTNLPGERIGALIAVMLLMFLLGFFLDFIEITFVVVPIVAPILLLMDIHPVWLGVMFALNLQTSFLTPPFGFALFYLRGVAPDSLATSDIYKGALPFIAIQLLMLLLLAAVPSLALWLPARLF